VSERLKPGDEMGVSMEGLGELVTPVVGSGHALGTGRDSQDDR
jgi:hypothetical protein